MIHRAVKIVVGLLFGTMVHVSADVLMKPDNSSINYYGRLDRSDAATALRFNKPGSSIEAAFSGLVIGVELNDGGGSYFNVEIDGVVVDMLNPSTTTKRTIRTDLSTTNDADLPAGISD